LSRIQDPVLVTDPESEFTDLLACTSLQILKYAILVCQKSRIALGHFDPLSVKEHKPTISKEAGHHAEDYLQAGKTSLRPGPGFGRSDKYPIVHCNAMVMGKLVIL
jgi:hypothetical protein